MARARSKIFILCALVVVLAGLVSLNLLDQRLKAKQSEIKITPAPNAAPPPKIEGKGFHEGSTPGFYQKITVDISFTGTSKWAAELLDDLKRLAGKDPTKLKVSWTVPGQPAPPNPPGAMFVLNDGKELGIVVEREAELKQVPANYTGYVTAEFLQYVKDLTEKDPPPWAPALQPKLLPAAGGQPR